MMNAKLISIDEAGKTLGVSRSTVYNLIAAGNLLTVKIGRRCLIKTSSIAKLAGDLANDA
jgi:excisionase family DNA binding protein